MPGSPQEWYLGLPIFTRTWLTAVVITALGVRFGYANPYKIMFDYVAVFTQFQVWRILTCFLFLGPLSFNWIFQMMMLCVEESVQTAREGPRV